MRHEFWCKEISSARKNYARNQPGKAFHATFTSRVFSGTSFPCEYSSLLVTAKTVTQIEVVNVQMIMGTQILCSLSIFPFSLCTPAEHKQTC